MQTDLVIGGTYDIDVVLTGYAKEFSSYPAGGSVLVEVPDLTFVYTATLLEVTAEGRCVMAMPSFRPVNGEPFLGNPDGSQRFEPSTYRLTVDREAVHA